MPTKPNSIRGLGKGFAAIKAAKPDLHHELSVKGGKARAVARYGLPFKSDQKKKAD